MFDTLCSAAKVLKPNRALVFLFLHMWKTIWKQFLFVNMSIILIVVIIG